MTNPHPDAMALELSEQLETWKGLWARRAELEALARAALPAGAGRILLAGCGDCHAAAEYGASLLALRTRLDARALPAMELSRSQPYLLGPGTLLVALSISGRTPRVLEAALVARKAGSTVLALTDDPASPLAGAASHALVLGTAPEESLHRTDYADPEAARYVGYQRAVAQTKTFGAAELALALLTLAWEELAPSGRGSPRAELEAALAGLPSSGEAAGRAGFAAAEFWKDVPARVPVTFCASGPGFPAARFAAYKLLELASPAACTDLEEYCHTYYLTTGEGSPVAFLAHDPVSLDRAREIAPVVLEVLGGSPVTLGPGPEAGCPPGRREVALPAAPPEVAPILLAHASAHLVRRVARAWGLDTDRFRAGLDEERYVRGSTRIIRDSRIRA